MIITRCSWDSWQTSCNPIASPSQLVGYASPSFHSRPSFYSYARAQSSSLTSSPTMASSPIYDLRCMMLRLMIDPSFIQDNSYLGVVNLSLHHFTSFFCVLYKLAEFYNPSLHNYLVWLAQRPSQSSLLILYFYVFAWQHI